MHCFGQRCTQAEQPQQFFICYMYHHFENLCSIPRALALTNTRSLLDKPNVYAVNETESTHTIPTMKI